MTDEERRRLERARADWLRCEAAARTPARELVDAYIEAAILAAGGNVVRAAQILGMNRRTLYRRGKSSRLWKQ